MKRDREQAAFAVALWTFLVLALLFFAVLISLDRIVLPAPLWLMLVLLDAGFIVFLFLPRRGRRGYGPPGAAAPARRWYPHRIEHIVERDEAERVDEDTLREAGRAVRLVPLVPLLIVLAVLVFAFPSIGDEERWYPGEEARLTEIFERAGAVVAGIEGIAERGAAAARAAVPADPAALAAGDRVRLVAALDSIAGELAGEVEPFGEMGLQVRGPGGERIAWGGRPRFLGGFPAPVDTARIFTARTRMYTLLVRVEPLPGGGRLVVDVPLEVNYRINNRFLRSTGLAEILGERWGERIVFNFTMGEHRGELRWRDGPPERERPQIRYTTGEGLRILGIVYSAQGLPLAHLRVHGDPYATVVAESESRRAFRAGLLVVLAVVVIARWVYGAYGKRIARGERTWPIIGKRILILAGFLIVIRFLLLRLEIPSRFLGTHLFDPALFADDFPGGITRTTGDFLLTALFFVMLVMGAIKTVRTYHTGLIERGFRRGAGASPLRVVGKAIVIFGALALSLTAAARLVTRVVLNANPRLIGLDVSLIDLPVVALHLALLFSVAGLFILCLFIMRLVLVSGGAGLAEGLAAAGIALVALALLPGAHWTMPLAAVALAALAFRIFPLLRKEEITSVVFASFFLVLVTSFVIYGAANGRYTELRRQRVIEKAQDFNYPEDTWLQVILPDLCQDIATDRDVASKLITRRESAAFEIWAESALSRFNLSCLFRAFDAEGTMFSRFAVGMPIVSPPGLPPEAATLQQAEVFEMRQETGEGAIYYLGGVAPVHDLRGRHLGRIEIVLPYFFENPEFLARTGPAAPEILHNIDVGSVAPRIDEPENLLVARVRGGAVAGSSSPHLVGGTPLPAGPGEWFRLELEGETYDCVSAVDEAGDGYLVGYRDPGLIENLLVWATIVSLDTALTVLSLLALLLLRQIGVLGSVTPAVSFSGPPGFRQKLLLSFFAVAIVPVVILGILSGRYIQERFRAEGEADALAGARAAVSMIDQSVRAEAEAFAEGGEFGQANETGRRRWALFERGGALVAGDRAIDPPRPAASGDLVVIFDGERLWGEATVRAELPGGGAGALVYRRPIDDGFASMVADVLGDDVNIYHAGTVAATSERELVAGGFIDPLLDAPVYADIVLGRSRTAVTGARIGDYVYQVGSAALAPAAGAEPAVLSVPMLYQPADVQREILKSSALILGLLTLLFVATVTLGVFLAGRIFNPLAELRRGTRRIIDGDLGFRLAGGAKDEIGELVDSFNTMTAALGEARRELLERQRYLEAVLGNAATGVLATDRAGRLTTCNPSAERILGVERGRLVGHMPGEVDEPDLAPLLALFEEAGEGAGDDEAAGASADGSEAGAGETRGDSGSVRRGGGASAAGGGVAEREVTLFGGEERRTIKAVVAALEAAGERLGTVVVFDDLTELIRSNKLAAWMEMARQIAHEVKNPLTPIRLSAQFMKRAWEAKAGDFEEIFASGVDTIVQQTEILRRISSEFSSFGKVTSLRPERVVLAPFMAEVVSPYRGMEEVTVSLAEGEPVIVRADREGLRKIVVNLMENAVDAVPEGGRIDVGWELAGDRVRIVVLDDGTGLSGEVADRLFEPYFSTKTTGTGLGLAICRSLAREMDGDVTLRNRADGRGVEASVELPVWPDEA